MKTKNIKDFQFLVRVQSMAERTGLFFEWRDGRKDQGIRDAGAAAWGRKIVKAMETYEKQKNRYQYAFSVQQQC